MMKGFLKNGKYVGLMLMAIGLVFAGCVGDSSSGSSDNDKMAMVDAFPVELDVANDQLIFGDGAGSVVAEVNGHTIEVANAGAGNSAGGVHTVPVLLGNRDSDEYMANASISVVPGSVDANGTGALFDTADFIILGSNCNADPPNAIGCQTSVDGGAGYMFVEDGDFVTVAAPWNAAGAPLNVKPKDGGFYPKQIIHPECGSVVTDFVFSNQDLNYQFYATVTADYFPYGDLSDSRYDSVDRTTYYAVASLMDDAYLGPALTGNFMRDRIYRRTWMQGMPQRSTLISGFDGASEASGVTGSNNLAPGTQFGIAIGVEYADRIEAQVAGDHTAVVDFNSGYEYYWQIAAIMRYNEDVVNLVSGPNLVCNDQTDLCSNSKYRATNVVASPIVNSGGANGWVATTVGVPGTWGFASQAIPPYFRYYTDAGGSIYFPAGASELCLQCGQRGRAKLNVTPGVFGATTIYPPSAGTPAAWLTQDGVDPEVDVWIGQYTFEVDGGAASGSGSEFWFEIWSQDWNHLLGHTKETFWDSGLATSGIGADWTSYCYPFQGPAFMNDTNTGCDVNNDGMTQIVRGSQGERINYEILHSGRAAPRMAGVGSIGAYQQWPAHICVQ